MIKKVHTHANEIPQFIMNRKSDLKMSIRPKKSTD